MCIDPSDLLQMGNQALKEGQHSKAASLFEKFIKFYPNHPQNADAQTNYSFSLASLITIKSAFSSANSVSAPETCILNSPIKSLCFATEEIENCPNDPEAYASRAKIFEQMNQHRNATYDYQRAQKKNLTELEYMRNVSIAALNCNELESSMTASRISVAGGVCCFCPQAQLMWSAHRYEEAVQLLDAAVLNKEEGALLTRGKINFALGKIEEAENDFRECEAPAYYEDICNLLTCGKIPDPPTYQTKEGLILHELFLGLMKYNMKTVSCPLDLDIPPQVQKIWVDPLPSVKDLSNAANALTTPPSSIMNSNPSISNSQSNSNQATTSSQNNNNHAKDEYFAGNDSAIDDENMVDEKMGNIAIQIGKTVVVHSPSARQSAAIGFAAIEVRQLLRTHISTGFPVSLENAVSVAGNWLRLIDPISPILWRNLLPNAIQPAFIQRAGFHTEIVMIYSRVLQILKERLLLDHNDPNDRIKNAQSTEDLWNILRTDLSANCGTSDAEIFLRMTQSGCIEFGFCVPNTQKHWSSTMPKVCTAWSAALLSLGRPNEHLESIKNAFRFLYEWMRAWPLAAESPTVGAILFYSLFNAATGCTLNDSLPSPIMLQIEALLAPGFPEFYSLVAHHFKSTLQQGSLDDNVPYISELLPSFCYRLAALRDIQIAHSIDQGTSEIRMKESENDGFLYEMSKAMHDEGLELYEEEDEEDDIQDNVTNNEQTKESPQKSSEEGVVGQKQEDEVGEN